MKYLKLFESFEESEIRTIRRICKEYDIENYIINPEGSIDVNEDIFIYDTGLTKIPLKFNRVDGGFYCNNNALTTLEGSPIEVNGSFDCDNNLLTSFQYSPKIIRGIFGCSCNNIKSFEYFPSFVKDFSCRFNPIEEVWYLFRDTTKIELLNDFDIFRDEDTETPAIIMDRLNDFLLTIGKKEVKEVKGYKNI